MRWTPPSKRPSFLRMKDKAPPPCCCTMLIIRATWRASMLFRSKPHCSATAPWCGRGGGSARGAGSRSTCSPPSMRQARHAAAGGSQVPSRLPAGLKRPPARIRRVGTHPGGGLGQRVPDDMRSRFRWNRPVHLRADTSAITLDWPHEALTWHGKGDIRCESVPDPKIEDPRGCGHQGDGLRHLRFRSASVRRRHAFHGTCDVLGHKTMGEVVDVGGGRRRP